MGETTTYCRKGKLLLAMDRFLKCPTPKLLEELKASPSVVERGIATGIIGEGDRYHCETEVLGEIADESFWPSVTNKPRIIYCTYVFALELALDPERLVDGKARPIVTTWIEMPCKEVIFQTTVEESKHQINVYLLTSGAINDGGIQDLPPNGAPTYKQELWMIADAATIDAEWAKYAQQKPTYDDFDGPKDCPSGADVKILNLPGY